MMKLNLANAIRQCRNGRRAGKISEEVQQRVFRRLGVKKYIRQKTRENWTAMMELRANIEAENLPVLEAKRELEFDIFDIKYKPEGQKPVKLASMKLVAPTLDPTKDSTLTPEWWKEAGKRERALKKAGLLED